MNGRFEFQQTLMMINHDNLIYHFVMSDNNSKNSPQSQPTPTNRICRVSPLVFAILGIICSCIILFNMLTASMLNGTTNFSQDKCQYMGNRYLQQVNKIILLLFSLDVICIILFSFLTVLAAFNLCRMCKGDLEKEQENKLIFIIRTLLIYLLILASGCLFGNCVKTIVSLKLLSCSGEETVINHLYTNFQTLALISGICLLMALLIFIFYPKLWRQQGGSYLSVTEENSSHKSKRGLLLKVNEKKSDQVVPQNSYGLLLSVTQNKTEVLEDKSGKDFLPVSMRSGQKKTPRIFGKNFISNTKPGLSDHKSSSKQKNEPIKESEHTLQDLNRIKGKQLVRRPLNLELDLEGTRNYYKDLQSNTSEPHYRRQHTHKSTVDVESHLINLTEEGPPVQLGIMHYMKN